MFGRSCICGISRRATKTCNRLHSAEPSCCQTPAGTAAKYRDGTVISVDLVAKYLNDNIACVVEMENDRAKVGGSDTLADFHVRVTSLYERLHGQWRLVHQHADPITTPRLAESVLQK
jgi:hypothetical protein